MLIRKPSGGVSTIDGREEAPAAIGPESFFEGGEPLEFDAARYSGLSVGVPGTVATWDLALRRYGTLRLGRALAPGIAIARRGFKVDKALHEQILENLEHFDDVPSTAGIYLDGDRTPRDIGAVIRNVDLANAYALIGRLGLEGFYEGPIAEAMAAAAQDPPVFDDAEHSWRPGPLTTDDIAAYEAIRRPPTRIGYRGLDIWGMGPPSSGGSTVGEILNILEGYSLPSRDERVPGVPSPARGGALRVRRPRRLPRRSGLLRRAAERPALELLRGGATGADHRGGGRFRARRPRETPTATPTAARSRRPAGPRGRLHDPPHGRRPARDGRLLHVHDRGDRRQRDRRPRLGLPAQQRADRLRLRRPRGAQRTRGRQAPAQLDGADARDPRRPARPRRRRGRRARRSSRPSPRSSWSASTSG